MSFVLLVRDTLVSTKDGIMCKTCLQSRVLIVSWNLGRTHVDANLEMLFF